MSGSQFVLADWFSESKITYPDYLQLRSFENSIQFGIEKQTKQLIATNEQISRKHLHVLEETKNGITTLSASMASVEDSINRGVAELNATFQWGFSEMLVALGRMRDQLDHLVKLAQTPSQTWAYEQFDISRDEFRRGLYEEALESIQRAINGYESNTGHKTEFRFQFLLGSIYLGSYNNASPSIVRPGEAESAFLKAARYIQSDSPTEAARAYLCAGRAAYVQKRMNEAFDHTRLALRNNANLAEAHFQMAKILCSLHRSQEGMTSLRTAIAQDREYAIRAGGEGEFRPYEKDLNELLDTLRAEAKGKYEKVSSRFAAMTGKLSGLSIEQYAMNSIAESEMAEIDRYRASFEEEAKTNTLFGYLNAAQMASQSRDVFKSSIEGFKGKTTAKLRKEVDIVRKQMADLERTIPAKTYWRLVVPLVWGIYPLLVVLGFGDGNYPRITTEDKVAHAVVLVILISLLISHFHLRLKRSNLQSNLEVFARRQAGLESLVNQVQSLSLESLD